MSPLRESDGEKVHLQASSPCAVLQVQGDALHIRGEITVAQSLIALPLTVFKTQIAVFQFKIYKGFFFNGSIYLWLTYA